MTDLLQKIKIIEGSGLFDKEWYLSNYLDVAILKMDPILHFVSVGEALLRDPGPHFNTRGYLKTHPDLARAGAEPLLHYIAHGHPAGEGLRPRRTADRPDAQQTLREAAATTLAGHPKRMLSDFDRATEQKFMAAIESFFATDKSRVEDHLASVVMPTYNRRALIERAIRSVFEQTHTNWELLIVDDGSDDDTVAFIRKTFKDPRIKLFADRRGGVSKARNVALKNACGSFIFYLDSDNTWCADFLRTMLAYMIATNVDCAYSAAKVVSGGKTIGYRGEAFDWAECLKANYVDMNVFGHRASLVKGGGYFDETLRRMVDWDFILRYTKRSRPAFAPFIGCFYVDDKADRNRITIAQPYAYRAVVQVKNARNVGVEEVHKHIRYSIAIKIPAPYEKRAEWGDFHYANSLKKSFEKMGHSVRIDFLGQWYEKPVNHDQVVIVIRGLTKYEPRPGEINILWNISHPDQILFDEYDSYDLVYVASLSFPSLLNTMLGGKAQSLLQCSDSRIFTPRNSPVANLKGTIFVGNSRNEYRPMVKWAVEAGEDVGIFGTRWTQFVDQKYLKGENIENDKLATYYNGDEIVLNDHWSSMRDFGFVSNRLFDIVSAGGVAISDDVPSMKFLFGESIRTANDPKGFQDRLAEFRLAPPSPAKRLEMSAFIHKHHSFDARAEEIVLGVGAHLGLPSVGRAGGGHTLYATPSRMKVGLILQQGKAWPTSSGFIRLIAPLTADAADGQFETIILQGPDDPRLPDCDVCVVQRVAINTSKAADGLIAQLRAKGIALFVDNDDALSLLPEHAEADVIMRRLMSESTETWFSTEPLRTLYGGDAPSSTVLVNCLDPRIWRNYRQAAVHERTTRVVEILYMGTATHDKDFEVVVAGLDALQKRRPDGFCLTLIGAVRKPPSRSWIRTLPPPAQAGAYPRFVHWLRQQGPFDIGIAPLAETAFNSYKSDIKFLDYSALGLPVVMSRCACYEGVVRDGLAIGANQSEWCDALESLWDEKRRIAFAASGRDYVWNQRNALVAGQAIATRIMSFVDRAKR